LWPHDDVIWPVNQFVFDAFRQDNDFAILTLSRQSSRTSFASDETILRVEPQAVRLTGAAAVKTYFIAQLPFPNFAFRDVGKKQPTPRMPYRPLGKIKPTGDAFQTGVTAH
jgi:hypothetical protein